MVLTQRICGKTKRLFYGGMVTSLIIVWCEEGNQTMTEFGCLLRWHGWLFRTDLLFFFDELVFFFLFFFPLFHF
jgi:hypothetical protein